MVIPIKITNQSMEVDYTYKKDIILQKIPAEIELEFNFSNDWDSLQKNIVLFKNLKDFKEELVIQGKYIIKKEDCSPPGIGFYIYGERFDRNYKKPTNKLFFKVLSEDE